MFVNIFLIDRKHRRLSNINIGTCVLYTYNDIILCVSPDVCFLVKYEKN